MNCQKIDKSNMSYEEWLEFRADKIGSSDAPAVMGVSPYQTPVQLYYQKKGLVLPPDDNIRMKFGRDIEPVIRKWFYEETGIEIHEDKYIRVHKDYDFIIADLDGIGLENDNEIIVELKTISGKLLSQYESTGIPDYYYIQLQHQLLVTDLPYGYIAMIVFGNYGINNFIIQKYARNDELIEKMVEKEVAFHDNLVNNIPPEIMTKDDNILIYPETIKDNPLIVEDSYLKGLILEYMNIDKAEKEIKNKKAELQNEIFKFIRDHDQIVMDGKKIATIYNSRNVSLDTRLLKSEHPELYEKYKKEKLYKVLKIVNNKDVGV